MSDPRSALEKMLGRDGVASMQVPGHGEVPAACPADEAQVAETIRLAARSRWRVLPAGNGTKLDWSPRPKDVDVVLSTRRLAGIVAYEPGDGTLTARAGTAMDALERSTSSGRNHLTPRVPAPARATIGGVLASGQSGVDRLRYGPARHHVLGMRVALADGTIAKCGGKLVKNVTGYDLHRLYCGSAGSLCVVTEVTLRLFAGFERERLLTIPATDRADALRIAASVDALRLDPLCLRCENVLERGRWRVHILLAGREAVVDDARSRLVAGAGEGEGEGEESIERMRDAELALGRWAEVRATGRPSRIAGGLARLAPETPVVVDPAIAAVSVFDPAAAEALAGSGLSVEVSGGRDVLPERPDLAAELALRLKRSFDPESLFAGGTARSRI